ncbi:hypothetical protein [Sphingobium nicotianae]|uniref:Uncharacterized protein n=1 Tax=Sphingobium nicotianae TaxID=2782607 RepID=A0A9X1IPU4_9SPHN|nr:hypothetical protein [Sphingobium nicotianae]MBT2186297.1 hypothetical protein [Sphingobium nicotianae]
MRHLGDLQPLGQPDIFADHPTLGRYSAKRSRWRFAVGSLEVGFDRASESLHAETPRPVQAAPRGGDFGRRLMTLVGVLSTVILTVALAGWLWTSRGVMLGGETVKASIIDRGDAIPSAQRAPGVTTATVIPTPHPTARLTALIEQRRPAPAVAPSPRAVVPIASGGVVKAQAADDSDKAAPSPDEAIVASGNYLLIPSVSRAVTQAMSSGEAQNWTAGVYHGLVVVGDVEPRDGKSCRQGTILLRDGSQQGRTQKFDRCV